MIASLMVFSMWFVYCAGCLLARNFFPELSIKLSFISVPIFISEVLLFLSGIILVYDLLKSKNTVLSKRIKFSFVFYVSFMLVIVSVGFMKWGTLALRHAALLYYTFFAFILMNFWRDLPFKKVFRFMPLLLLLLSRVLGGIYGYFTLSLLLLNIILLFDLFSLEKRKFIVFSVCLVLLILMFPFKILFQTSRTFMIANLSSVFFLFVAFLSIARLKKRYKLYISLFLISFFLLGVVCLSDSNSLRSFQLNKISQNFQKYDELYLAQKNSYSFKHIEPKLFNPDNKKVNSVDKLNKVNKLIPNKMAKLNEVNESISNGIAEQTESKPKPRDMITASNNITFRLFVWRDIVRELSAEKAWFGFGLGKPLRSHTIETLGWARGEWERDGWISAHNTYFHILYRFGLVGFVFIIAIFSRWYYLVKKTFEFESISDLILAAILLNFLVGTNFQPLLEMPYNAILFWGIWGILESRISSLKSINKAEK